VDDSTQQHRQPWLGLDIGTRRIGIALSNELGVAQPLMTLERSQPRRDQRSILRLARRYQCAGIVLGNPLLPSGAHSRQTERVHRFAAELAALLREHPPPSAAAPLQIHLWDERLTTVEAHQALDAAGHDRRLRRDLVDQVAAVLILQGWLDAQSGTITLLPPDP
jgi:putative Holliday junction resolvase